MRVKMVTHIGVVGSRDDGFETGNSGPSKGEGGETVPRAIEVRIFTSFEDENVAEHRRLARMTPNDRWRELAVLQARLWGEHWRSYPIVKRASWERLPW